MILSIIVPAHNEENNIATLIDKIESNISGIIFEVILVLDHCVDSTEEIAISKSKEYGNIRIIKNYLSPGFANALRVGFSSSRCNFILPIMGDLCDDLNTISKMYEKINEGYDIVCGSRYIKGGKRLGGSRLKSLLSCFGGRSINFLLNVPTHDIANAFKMYRKKVIDSINIESTGFEISMEITLKAHYNGFKISEVPTVWRERAKGKSSFKMFKFLPAYLNLYIWAIFRRFIKKKTVLLVE